MHPAFRHFDFFLKLALLCTVCLALCLQELLRRCAILCVAVAKALSAFPISKPSLGRARHQKKRNDVCILLMIAAVLLCKCVAGRRCSLLLSVCLSQALEQSPTGRGLCLSAGFSSLQNVTNPICHYNHNVTIC